MEDQIQLGIMYAKEGNFREAFKLLKNAMEDFVGKKPQDVPANLQSHYGLCLAVNQRDIKGGLEYCLEALKKEFYQPDLYLNLGRVYLLGKKKASAVQAFYQGLRLDDGHHGIIKELKRLGIRKDPILGFLPRSHFINRVLGRIRSRASKKSVKV